jgi:flagella basal body P-ring formation protein FlgA
MIVRILFTLLPALAAASAQCLPVSGQRILAGDMARTVPVFAAIAPDLTLGYAPAPGSIRTYGTVELVRLARRYGLALEPGQEVCFVRPLETLTLQRVTLALRAAIPAAAIDVVDFSRQPLPPGEILFTAAGLQASPATSSPLLWRGVVSAAGQSDFPIWAKVRIRVSGQRVTAAEALIPGRPIGRSQLREEPYEGPPGLPNLSQIVGRVPRRPIAAGTAIERQWLEAPADVVRGERVQVEIRSGKARIVLDGQAQSSGLRGELVGIRNPLNGKVFYAKVADRGRVVVEAPSLEIAAARGADR